MDERLPVLTAVPTKCYGAWIEFTGGFGATLVCERRIVDEWWRDMSRRESRARVLAQLEQRLDYPASPSRNPSHWISRESGR